MGTNGSRKVTWFFYLVGSTQVIIVLILIFRTIADHT